MEQITDLFPKGDKDDLFTALESKEYWLLLLVDSHPVGAMAEVLSQKMANPPRTFSVDGLPPIMALPKKDFTTESLAELMSAATPGSPLPPELLARALGERDFILCAEPQSLPVALKAMENFLSMHKDWKVERFGVQLFTVTHRMYQHDYLEAIDFLLWMIVGIVIRSGAVRKKRTDVEIATNIASTIADASKGGTEKAVRTVQALDKSMRFLEPALKVLDVMVLDKNNRDRATSVLNMWIRDGINPNACAMWVASNIGLYLTFHEKANHEMIQKIAETMVQRIRKDLDEQRKIETEQRSTNPRR
jgi:hypothetical protein